MIKSTGKRDGVHLTLEELKLAAVKHTEDIANLEITTLRSRLESLYPRELAVTIQVFQPINGGRLVDVGPRPIGAGEALVFQRNTVGKTGDIFMDEQAPHRFIPKSDRIGQTAEGSFTDEILQLEQMRYPHIGTWSCFGPPEDATIYQLPLAPLPLTLQPRETNKQYRFANLGAVYTISGKTKKPDDEERRMRLILYALRAGEIAQKARFETLCGGDEEVVDATECRIRVAKHLPVASWNPETCEATKIDRHWRSNVTGGFCRLVGSLILHHHWWFPYDPVGYKLLCSLTSAAETERIYYLHGCCPPERAGNRDGDVGNPPNVHGLIEILAEDIVQIVRGYRGGELEEDQKVQIRNTVLTMLLQLTGVKMRMYCGRLFAGKKLTRLKSKGNEEVYVIGPRREWAQDIRDVFDGPEVSHSILRPSTLKNKLDVLDYSYFVLSLLSPHTPARSKPQHGLRGTYGLMWTKKQQKEKGQRQELENDAYVLVEDENGPIPHFLYWHTRAMLTVEDSHIRNDSASERRSHDSSSS